MQLGSDRKMPGWGLILSIPTPSVTTGRLSVDVGGRLHKIDLAYNQAATRQVVATPSHATYRVVEVAPRFGPLDARLIKECDGLRRGCTAFGHLARASKLIRRATEILPGQDYVIVWHSDDEPTIPERFDAIPVSPDKQWGGAIISIPRHVDNEERHWVNEYVGLPIKNALPTIVPIWPPLCERRSPQLFEAVPHPEFLFSVDSLEGHEAAVFFRAMGQDQVVNVQDAPAAILRVPSGAAEEFKIVARARNEAEVLVSRAKQPLNWQPSGITLVFEEGGARATVSMCDSRAAPLVSAVRSGDANLVSSSGPKYAKAKIRERIRGLWFLVREVECDAKDVADMLNSVLKNNSRDLQFDFGAFGHLLVDSPIHKHDAINLSDRIRRQILGYLFHYPHVPSPPLTRENLEDEKLIAIFRKIRPTRQSLAQHVALTKIINALTT
jgi:hypothetical protein